MSKRQPRQPDGRFIAEFLATGKFVEGTIFTRCEDRNKHGHRIYWNVYCPICADDEYTRAGLCDGTFRTLPACLAKGHRPCRCKTNPRLTPEQWELRVQTELEKRDNGLSLVRIVGNGSAARLALYCENHGDFEMSMMDFIYGGCGCAECVVHGFSKTRPATLYVLKVEGLHTSFTGYGISNSLTSRMHAHNKSLKQHGFKITEKEVFEMDGHTAAEMERSLKNTFPLFSQEVTGFKREATFIQSYSDVVSFVKESVH